MTQIAREDESLTERDAGALEPDRLIFVCMVQAALFNHSCSVL